MTKIVSIKKFWQKLRTKLLSNRQPITSCHWRFLLPYQGEGVKIHRYVFMHAYSGFPLALRGLAYLYNLSRWWFYFAWVAVFKVYKFGSNSCLENYNVTKSKQLLDIFTLAFVYCIPPSEYYPMRLHQWPRVNWLDFAYDFQAIAWHEALNYRDAKTTETLLNDKAAFESFLTQHGLSTIIALQTIKQGVEITADELAQLPEICFLKPTIGNRSMGCFAMHRDDSIGHDAKLRFIWFKDASEMPYKDLKDLNRLFSKRDYLIQPLLMNHPDFEQLMGTQKLATIRLITSNVDNKCVGQSAVLETARPYKPMFYWNVVIDIETGEFIEPQKDATNNSSEFETWFTKLRNKQCPQWQDLLAMCLRAHSQLPKMLTIGWDVSLATNGPVIVEGNVSWGLRQSQVLTRTPLLHSSLGEVYLNRISPSPALHGNGSSM